jgi:regulator of sigma E protease
MQVTPAKIVLFGQPAGDIQADPDPGIMPVVVGEVTPNTPAAESGLTAGDRIVSINGERVRSIRQSKDLVEANKAAPIILVIERNSQLQTVTASVRKLDDGTERLGFAFAPAELPPEKASVSSAVAYAFNTNIENLQATGSVLGQVFAGKRSVKDSGIGGPVGIFQQSAQATKLMGATGFFLILGLISLSLGIFNLLPIPLLDGGQIMVLAVEKVMSLFGKTLSMVARERIQLTGLAIVLLLMVTVIFFDVSRLVGR